MTILVGMIDWLRVSNVYLSTIGNIIDRGSNTQPWGRQANALPNELQGPFTIFAKGSKGTELFVTRTKLSGQFSGVQKFKDMRIGRSEVRVDLYEML